MRLDATLTRRLARRAFVAKAANAFDAVRRKLSALYERLSDQAARALLAEVIARLADQPDNISALDLLRGLDLAALAGAALPAAALNDLNEALYLAGAVESAGKRLKFSLGPPDYRALDLIGQQNYFWLMEHYSADVQQGFDALLNQAYAEGWSRDRLAEALQQHFQALKPASRAYFNGLADHSARKLREIGRVAGYERAGIQAVKVKAILDQRTSKICRAMNGRIIPVATLAAQKERILNAKGKEELKRAQPWLKEGQVTAVADLPEHYGLPPYHYRCRTITVAYFPELSEAGKKIQWADDAGKMFQDKILFARVDEKLGRELLLTEQGLGYAGREKHPTSRAKIEAALRSITHKGANRNENAREDEMVTLSQNGVILFFRQNLIYNAYVPTRDSEKYFRDQVKQAIPLKKGDDDGPNGSD